MMVAAALIEGVGTSKLLENCRTGPLGGGRSAAYFVHNSGWPYFELGDKPDGMANAMVFDDSGEWWATKLAPAVVQQ